jgi:hypothetical protein
LRYRLSIHVLQELQTRRIPEHLFERVFNEPQQVVPELSGRKAFQSKLDFGTGKLYLLRAIVDDGVDPPVVVTVYRTSKLRKYWRQT